MYPYLFVKFDKKSEGDLWFLVNDWLLNLMPC
uniref:Uncharacterized protein n=1 Tax=Rhizophora mucronata TaxID=61149 RepID=A0A2P2QPF5_RHIMU